ncbi:peptide deformylase [Candidatus Vidania fulgoroideorum]
MNIIKYPNDILRYLSRVVLPNYNINSIISNMRNKLLLTNGLGISAPQLGFSKRIFIIAFGSKLITFINPVVIYRSSILFGSFEGCLSIPRYYVNILRSRYIMVEYLDCNYVLSRVFLKGYLSSCLQHEIDHLNGILIIDRV